MTKNKKNRGIEGYYRGFDIIILGYRNIIEVLMAFPFGENPFKFYSKNTCISNTDLRPTTFKPEHLLMHLHPCTTC